MRRVAGLLAVLLPLTPAVAGAAPLSQLVTVQPIDLCTGGDAVSGYTGCAFPLATIAGEEAVTQAIFAQANVGFDFLPVKFLLPGSIPGNPLPAYTADQTVHVDPSGNPIDQAHLLLRLPNPAASSNPTTLDAYFVTTLSLLGSAAPIHGYGLVGSNGSIIDAGGALDTLAHELGHNLGLTHVDGQPYDDANNLMRSVARNVPVTPTDPRIGTTLDLLTSGAPNDQIAQAKSPLFTVGLASATAGKIGAFNCTTQLGGCEFDVQFQSSISDNSLNTVKVRFQHASDLADTLPQVFPDVDLSGRCGKPAQKVVPLTADGGDGVEIDYTYPAGCIQPGNHMQIGFDYPRDPTDTLLDGVRVIYNAPVSFEFDFSSGVTSTALYSETANVAEFAESDSDARLHRHAGLWRRQLLPARIGQRLRPAEFDGALFGRAGRHERFRH